MDLMIGIRLKTYFFKKYSTFSVLLVYVIIYLCNYKNKFSIRDLKSISLKIIQLSQLSFLYFIDTGNSTIPLCFFFATI